MPNEWKEYVDDLQEQLDRLTDMNDKSVDLELTLLRETSLRLSELLSSHRNKEVAELINSNLVGVLMVGQGPSLQYANGRAHEILGSNAEIRSVLGADNEVFLLADQATACGDHLPWLRALAGQNVDNDLIFVRPKIKSGDKWIQVCAFPQRQDRDDAVIAAIVAIMDTTEHTKAEHRLRQNKQALQQRLAAASGAQEGFSLLLAKLRAPLPGDKHAPGQAPAQAGAIGDRVGEESNRLALVADDLQITQVLLQGQLNKMGFEVHLANNGREAVEAAARNRYDIIFMDCEMPVMDGYDATRAIRAAEGQSEKRTPILAVTAYNREGDRAKCLAAGVDDFVEKGWDLKLLINMINSVMKERQDMDQAPLPLEFTGKDDNRPLEEPDIGQIKVLEDLYGADDLSNILRLFAATAENSMDCIQAAVTDRNALATHHFAYCLKGPSALLALDAIADVCRQIAESAIRGKWFDAEDMCADLQSAFTALRKALQIDSIDRGRPGKAREKSRAPAWSLNLLEQRVGKPTALAMAQAFSRDTGNILNKMGDCIRKYDSEGLYSLANKLAGSSASIFIAKELRGLCKQLESLCDDEHCDWVEAAALFERLSKSYNRTSELVETYVKANEEVPVG